MAALPPEPNEICPGIRDQGDHVFRRALGLIVSAQQLEQNAQAVMQPRLLLGVVGRGVFGRVLPNGVLMLPLFTPALGCARSP